MTALYVETSAVVAWLFGEPEASSVLESMGRAETLVTSILTVAEAERAIRRAAGMRQIREASASRLRGMLARERRNWNTMSLTSSVMERSGQAFPIEPVRTLDAIHLSTALVFEEAYPGLAVLTRDRRVAENAAALGLTVVAKN